MIGNKIFRWFSVGFLLIALMGIWGCSKTTGGVKRYLGMKTSPTKEFQRKYPQFNVDKEKEASLPALTAQKTSQPGNPSASAAPAAATGASTTIDLKSAAQKIADEIAETLPNAQGYVVDLKEELVYLSLSVGDGIKEGNILDLIRKGREFKHPYTGKVLGNFEDNIGVLKIVQVKEEYSVAEVISLQEGIEVKAGDISRITSGRVKLAVLPCFPVSGVELDHERMTSELVRNLKNTKRFDLYDIDTLKVWMLERGLKPEDLSSKDTVEKVMKSIPSQWYLVSSVRELQGVKVLESRLISSYHDEPITIARAVLKEEVIPAATVAAPITPQAPSPTIQAPQKGRQAVAKTPPSSGRGPKSKRAVFKGEYWTSRTIDFEIMGLDVGDVDNDGENELVLAAKDRVEILKWDGEKFQRLHSYSRGKGNSYYLALDMADINGNGREEIYVTNFIDDEIRSFVLEINENRLKVLQKDLFRFLSVVDLPGKEPILLSQKVYPSTDEFLVGKVERYGWKGKKLKKLSSNGDLKKIPRKFNVYSITLGDLDGDGVQDVITLSDSGKLGLFNRAGDMLWESSDTYGGKVIRSDAQQQKNITPYTDVFEEIIEKASVVNAKMLIRDLDGDGHIELIVPKNLHTLGGPLKGIGGFSNSFLVGLRWNGVTLVEEWQTEKTGGYVTDIAMKDVDNDGQDELVAAVVLKTGFLKMGRKSAVYVFEFQWQ